MIGHYRNAWDYIRRRAKRGERVSSACAECPPRRAAPRVSISLAGEGGRRGSNSFIMSETMPPRRLRFRYISILVSTSSRDFVSPLIRDNAQAARTAASLSRATCRGRSYTHAHAQRSPLTASIPGRVNVGARGAVSFFGYTFDISRDRIKIQRDARVRTTNSRRVRPGSAGSPCACYCGFRSKGERFPTYTTMHALSLEWV